MPDDELKDVMIPTALSPLDNDVDFGGDNATMDEVLELHNKIEGFARAIRHIRSKMNARMVEWIQANSDIEVGTVRYYVGGTKKYKAKDDTLVMEALYTLFEGDQASVMACMSANPWKPGQIRKLLEAATDVQLDWDFDGLFDTVEQLDLKTGKPKRGLQKADSKFL